MKCTCLGEVNFSTFGVRTFNLMCCCKERFAKDVLQTFIFLC